MLSILSLIFFFTHGLNYGIDFKGGTLLEVKAPGGKADIGALAPTLEGLGLGEVQLQEIGANGEVMIRIAQQPGGDAASRRRRRRSATRSATSYTYERVEVIGPRVSQELVTLGTVGIFAAIGSILLYLWFRFDWQFAVGAMIANVHDIVLTIGFMSVTQIDFDLTSVAALLTILGYSLNDTVVIYDRIRELLRKYKRLPMADLLDNADQRDPVALDHHPCDRLARAARAAALRRPRDPQLHRDHAFRRRAGRHLYFDLHRLADPDLSRRCGRARRRGGGSQDGGAEVRASDGGRAPLPAPARADRRLWRWRLSLRRHVPSRLAPGLPSGMHAWPVAEPCDSTEAILRPSSRRRARSSSC